MNVGEMQRKLSQWAERDKKHRFFDLYHLMYDTDWLRLAHDYVKQNAGSKTAGCDGLRMSSFDERLEENLRQLAEDLRQETFEPYPVRRVLIPKTNGKMRRLGIPIVRSHCTSIQWTWGLLGDTDRVMTVITLSQFDYRGAEVARDRRRRTGLRSSAMISGVSLIHRGLVGVARMLSKRPAVHQSAIVETSTFRMLAAALAE